MKHAIKDPRNDIESEEFARVRSELGKALGDAMHDTGTSFSQLSKLAYGTDKQTTLIRRTVEGKVDPHIVTLTRYALLLGKTLKITIE